MPSMSSNEPVVLTELPTETMAAMLIARLENEGIRAEMLGALTSAFRAEVPGDIQVLVRAEDLDRAGKVLEQWQGDRG